MGTSKRRVARPVKPRSRAGVVRFFKSCETAAQDDEGELEQTGLIMRLKFSKKVEAMQSFLAEQALPADQQLTETPAPAPTVKSEQAPHTPADELPASPRETSTKTPVASKSPGKQRNATPQTARSTTRPRSVRKPRATDKDISTMTPTAENRAPAQTFAPFVRKWKDETQYFSMKKVVASLRPVGKVVDELSTPYNWFPEAVPIDALFPPGVLMTAKEINAYYPHHIRWKGVMLRLINNEYRGPEIIGMQSWFRGISEYPMTGTQMNDIIRAKLRNKIIPHFKTSEGGFKGKPDRNLNTAHLTPGTRIEQMRKGFVVPTFNDLLKGLKYLPTGLDARGLTQCLMWYLNHRDMFTPRLEFNVLHTQSLIRVLQQPLKEYGPQNLDMNALEEWKIKGKYTEKKVEDEKRSYTIPERKTDELKRPKLEVSLNKESVQVHVPLQLRHVLTFPLMAMINMAAEGLAMGVEKAEARKAVITGTDSDEEEDIPSMSLHRTSVKLENEPDIGEAGADVESQQIFEEDQPAKPKTMEELFRGYRIPKRARVEEEPSELNLHPNKKAVFESYQNVPTGPRALSTTQSIHHTSQAPGLPGQTSTPTALAAHRSWLSRIAPQNSGYRPAHGWNHGAYERHYPPGKDPYNRRQ